jgi:GPH family glycoside/pentoside/hexuronide:cation symporter
MTAGVILTELSLKGLSDSMIVRDPDAKPITFRDFLDTLKSTFGSRNSLVIVLTVVVLTSVTFIYYTGYLYYMDNVLNVSGLLAIIPDAAGAGVQAAVFAVLVILVRRFGSRDTLRLGLLVTLGCYLGLTFANGYLFAAVFYILAMTGFACFWALAQPLTGMLADMNELESGTRKTGTLAAFIALLIAPANALMMLLFTTLLEKIGYDGRVTVQTADTVQGLKLIIGLMPAGGIILGLILLSFLPLGNKKERELNAVITARRSERDNKVTEAPAGDQH